MQVSIQNRSLLYKKDGQALVPEGVHSALLVEVRTFNNSFGERVGLVFAIDGGQFHGVEVMESAVLKDSPRGKLFELVRGIGGDGSLASARKLVGQRFHIAIRHETNKTGKTYAAIAATFK